MTMQVRRRHWSGYQWILVPLLTVTVQAATPDSVPPYNYGRSPSSNSRSAQAIPRTAANSPAVRSNGATPARPFPGQTQARPIAPPPRPVAPPAAKPAATTAREAANTPTVEQALKLVPIQPNIDYAIPSDAEISKCKISVQKTEGQSGWVVEDGNGVLLRRFLDTNNDNKVDQWCYFKDGLEVYRDIDSDFNGKADQYRWFSTAGTRWGIDKDEDGAIDSWNAISPEEVTSEIVAALAKQDAERFSRLVLTPGELRKLGLGNAKTKEIEEKISNATTKFQALVRSQKAVKANSKWSQMSASQPGVVPVGTEGSTQDLDVYENVLAIVQTDSDHTQVQIGTLVKVGNAWRIVDAPQIVAEGQNDMANSGIFFKTQQAQRPPVASNGPSEKAQEILTELERLDAAANKAATVEEQASLHAKRADLLEKMATEATKPEDRTMWLRQLADMISAAVQSGSYPDGAKRLESLFTKLQQSEQDQSLAGYIRFRQLLADHGLAMQAKGADFSKVQTEWLKSLERFVTDYPKSSDSAEAMLQLGMTQEFAGQEEDAKKWYTRVASEFPDAPAARKSNGAKTRLDSVGKILQFRAKTSTGEMIDLAKYRGQMVLIQYWATWCEPCKADIVMLKELVAKYGQSGFTVIGVNVDNSADAMKSFLDENRVPWAQVYEEGGLESRPAVDLGVLTLPVMLLIDQDGKVIHRNITISELTTELKKLGK
jgi:thiol-disulfide isomerase/thioredoxin